MLAVPAFAAGLAPRDGWRVMDTSHSFADLVKRVEESVKANKMGIVTQASASAGAAAQGFTIPGNKVIGVYRNDFARRMLAASLAAGIEAPIRLYVTENPDGKTTLSYKLPSTVFAPYFGEGGEDLRKLAVELDGIFAKIAEEAVKS
ncbi:MAG: DUF302 domain-containing protein [Rhodomicrobium sp.]|nr:DUF302 domain-containing protein [Rhodomicrobium sp.]